MGTAAASDPLVHRRGPAPTRGAARRLTGGMISYIYIYIYAEREREVDTYVYVYIYIYMYVYVLHLREYNVHM